MLAARRQSWFSETREPVEGVPDRFAQLVLCSPPYPNNYDYADATRLEMSFFREISGWGDLQHTVRDGIDSFLFAARARESGRSGRSSFPTRDRANPRRTGGGVPGIGKVRLSRGGKKTYHLMVACYFLDLAKVWKSLRRVCDSPSRACFVIGDSAPYGVYVPVMEWLGDWRLRRASDRLLSSKREIGMSNGRTENIAFLYVRDDCGSRDDMAANETNANASAGHKLGQLVGDWFEEYFVFPLLTHVAEGLRLYLDYRFQSRSARGEKILWADEEGQLGGL